MPLCYTGDAEGLKDWIETIQADGTFRLLSPTGRDVAFYLGPARRYYGDPDATLKRNRGVVALVLKRSLLKEVKARWTFSPFDVGEVLYHWRHGKVSAEHGSESILRELLDPSTCRRKVGRKGRVLAEAFRTFLDGAYEDPRDYLSSWEKPRVAAQFSVVQNTLYRAAGDRWFGRFRPFAPAWTFEVARTGVVRVDKSHLHSVVVIEVEATEQHIDSLVKCRLDVERVKSPSGDHPDLHPMLLELRTSEIIRRMLDLDKK